MMKPHFGKQLELIKNPPELSLTQQSHFDAVCMAIMACFLDDETLQYCRESAIARLREIYADGNPSPEKCPRLV